MSTKQKRVFWLLLALGALSLSALGFASARRLPLLRTIGPQPRPSQSRGALAGATLANHVIPGYIRPQLRASLTALGDRLVVPGKERLTVTGTLSKSGEPSPIPMVAILEYPDQLHLTLQEGAQPRIIVFDGQHPAAAAGNSPSSDELDLVETLVYDAAEHFFATQMQGKATRFLGGHFRMDDGSSPTYSGPYYDIYEVGDQIKSSPGSRLQTKYYYLNSKTQLLGRVHYQLSRGGSTVKVENLVGNWQQAQGEQIPTRLERTENGASIFVLNVGSVIFGPHVADGIFIGPGE